MKYWQRSYPYSQGLKSELFRSLKTIGLATILLLAIRPFGLEAYSWMIVVGFGLSVMFSAFLNSFLWLGLGSFMIDSSKWTIGKEIIKSLHYLVLNITAILLYASFITTIQIDGMSIVNFSLITLLFAIIPLSFRAIQTKNFLLKEQLRTAQISNLEKVPQKEKEESLFTLQSDQVKEAVEFSIDNLLFIKAEKNYIKITYLKQGQVTNSLIRLSLKKALAQLNQPMVIQCHRSYLVNLNRTKIVNTSTPGLKLKFKDDLPLIPVSRSHTKQVRELLLDS